MARAGCNGGTWRNGRHMSSVDSAQTSLRVELETSVDGLLRYCRQNNWAGFDPYDALNSRVFALSPLSRSRYCRIALTQALKRLPVNLRPLLGISKEQNPKGIALFLSALIKLSRVGMLREDDLIESLVGPFDCSAIAEHLPLVLGIQFSMADADGARSSRGAKPRLHGVRRQRAAGLVRTCMTCALPRNGCQRRRLHCAGVVLV